ncbi:hypothetical protein CV093_12610 [Oceanobacillus sp. 143]|nr:hypothetical protein CV093_12610 [Oceanobacillus sp. 143]
MDPYPMPHHMYPAMQMPQDDDCGCGSNIPVSPYAAEQQMHQAPMPNQEFHHQPMLNTQQMFPTQFGMQPDANFLILAHHLFLERGRDLIMKRKNNKT